jgi:ElaB/YqjD/DUF883 family membrane-anchored ribosome-binding protein
MAEKRSDLENIDRVDASNYSVRDGDSDATSHSDEMELVSSESDTFDPGSDRSNMDLAAGDDDVPVEAEHIKGQIEETRNQMGETIDAIQDKLSFSNISEQVSEHVNNAVETAKGAVYDATIGKAANLMKNFSGELSNTTIVQTAKNNPFPFILIGLGAGMLAYQSYAGKGNGKSRRHEFTSGRNRGYGKQTAMNTGQGGTIGEVRDTMSNAADTVSEAAGTAYDKVTGLVESAKMGTGDVVNRAYDKVGELKTTAVEQYDHYIEENPLAVGAVALALGAAVGMAIPSTRYESRLLGEYRQDLVDKAQTTASQLLDKTKEVVTEAGRTVSDQAKASITQH